jgi:hypothetical protein
MRIIHELMDNRVVAIVLNHAGQGVIGLDLEDFSSLDTQDRLISIIKSVFRHLAPLNLLNFLPARSPLDRT